MLYNISPFLTKQRLKNNGNHKGSSVNYEVIASHGRVPGRSRGWRILLG